MMFIYLQIFLSFSLIGLTVLHLYQFIFNQTQLKTFRWTVHLWILILYTLFITFYYLENKMQFFQSKNENFMILGWLMTLISLIEEWMEEKNLGFLFTPLVTFISLLGIIAVSRPPIIVLGGSDLPFKIVKLENLSSVLSLLADVYYFYAVILAIINYRLYLELKHHLPLFFNSRLPSISQTDSYINRYLIWGNFLLASSFLVLILTFLGLNQPSLSLDQPNFLFLQKIVLLSLVLIFFLGVQLLRWKHYLTVKLNLVVMVCGSFLLLLHLFHL